MTVFLNGQVAQGERPLTVGLFFSMGHSTIVLIMAFLCAVGVWALSGGDGGDNEVTFIGERLLCCHCVMFLV